ncbi:major facilitator superfamily domain-containing protein [Blastocladiella britannica]|nr:major facilitator superfamily domain-containing protein [Blastocladiella britannica]
MTVSRTHVAVLLLSCGMVWGNYHCYDLPAALALPLRAHLRSTPAVFQWQLNAMYTAYSLPNLVSPLLGGLLIDRLGTETTTIAFAVTVAVGATLFWIGTATRLFPLMMVGRVLAGLGGESLEVAGTTVTTEWFVDAGYLSAALAINLSTSRIAAALQDIVSPWLATVVAPPSVDGDDGSWVRGAPLPALLGVAVSVVSVAAAVALIRTDSAAARTRAGLRPESPADVPLLVDDDLEPSAHGDRRYQQSSNHPTVSQMISPVLLQRSPVAPVASNADDDDDNGTVSGLSMAPSSSNQTLVSPVGGTRALPKGHVIASHGDKPAMDRTATTTTATAVHASSSDAASLPDHAATDDDATDRPLLLGLSASFWALCALTVLLYGSTMPFIHISSDVIQSKWYSGDAARAGAAMAIPDLTCAVLTPLLGLLVDRTRVPPALFLPLASVLLVAGHAMVFVFPPLSSPWPALLVIGTGSAAFAATLWPVVPLVVADRQLATAYGAMTVALNVALAGVPLMVAAATGAAATTSDPWKYTGWLFLSMAAAAGVAATGMLAWDARYGSGILVGRRRHAKGTGTLGYRDERVAILGSEVRADGAVGRYDDSHPFGGLGGGGTDHGGGDVGGGGGAGPAHRRPRVRSGTAGDDHEWSLGDPDAAADV